MKIEALLDPRNIVQLDYHAAIGRILMLIAGGMDGSIHSIRKECCVYNRLDLLKEIMPQSDSDVQSSCLIEACRWCRIDIIEFILETGKTCLYEDDVELAQSVLGERVDVSEEKIWKAEKLLDEFDAKKRTDCRW